MTEILLKGGHIANVDPADARIIGAHRWYVLENRHLQYARARIGEWQILMHRMILPEAPADMDIDHIDGDGLNNRRSNLRVVTRAENLWNKHNGLDLDGVSFNSRNEKWRVFIGHYGSRVDGGYYPDEATALCARAFLASKLRGSKPPEEFDYLQLSPASRRFLFKTTGAVA